MKERKKGKGGKDRRKGNKIWKGERGEKLRMEKERKKGREMWNGKRD